MDLILSLIAVIVVLCVIVSIRIARTDTEAVQAGRPIPRRGHAIAVACEDCWTRDHAIVRGTLRTHGDGLLEYLCDACWQASQPPDARFRCTDCDYQTDSPPGAINHHGTTHHRMVERASRCHAISPVSGAACDRSLGHDMPHRAERHGSRTEWRDAWWDGPLSETVDARAPRGLDPVTVRDGRVERIRGGAA